MNPQEINNHVTMLQYSVYGLIAAVLLIVYLGNQYITYLQRINTKLEQKILEITKKCDEAMTAERERLERVIQNQEVGRLDRAINNIERNIDGTNRYYKEEIEKAMMQLQSIITEVVASRKQRPTASKDKQ